MTQPFDLSNPEHRAFIPEGTCMLAYRGSIAHNMYIPGTDPKSIDDVDLMGIVVGQRSHYFGLTEWGSRGTKEIKQGKFDCVFYEIKKMFSLLLQGNPNVMSMLWLRDEDYLHNDARAELIIKRRGLFDGKHVYNAFAGYAHQQLSKMETRDPAELRMYLALTYEAKHRGIHPNHKGELLDYPEGHDYSVSEGRDAKAHSDVMLLSHLQHFMKKGENLGYLGDKRKGLVLEHGYDSKNAAHCVRLLRMAGEYLRTGVLNVFRSDAAELLDIKHGKWELTRVKQHADELFKDMKEARDKSPLPEGPNREKAEQLLMEILYDAIYWD